MTFLEFEKQIILEIIEQYPEYHDKLLQQYKNSQVIKREMTGHGFFTHFCVKDTTASIGNQSNLQLGKVQYLLNDMKYGTDYILWVKNGIITCLEGFAYNEPFPENICSMKKYT